MKLDTMTGGISSMTLVGVRWAYVGSIPFVLVAAMTARGSAAESRSLSKLPLGAQVAVSAAVGCDNVAYHAVQDHGRFSFTNGAHGFEATLESGGGVRLRVGRARWGIFPDGVGYGDRVLPLPPGLAEGAKNRVAVRRGSVIEWYVNGPLGLQQGFTIERPPIPSLAAAGVPFGTATGDSLGFLDRLGFGAGAVEERPVCNRNQEMRGQPLTVRLALNGVSVLAIEPGGRGAVLEPKGGERDVEAASLQRAPHPSSVELSYSGLFVYDRAGRELPAWMELWGDTLAIRVVDCGAKYPIVVDPFIQKAKLTAADGDQNDQFGLAVAAGTDTVVVGAPFHNMSTGAVYVFAEPITGWTTTSSFSAKLTASDSTAGDNFGLSVAIGGETIVVGTPSQASGTRSFVGAVYVFTKPITGWTSTSSFNAKLIASDGAESDSLGTAVAISGDTVVAGAPLRNRAYVFQKPLVGWGNGAVMFEVAKLQASDASGGDHFGSAVAVDGDTVVVGAPQDDLVFTDVGSAYVFTKPLGGWSGSLTETAKLTPGASPPPFITFGSAVAVSGDTVVVGAPLKKRGVDLNVGAAFLYVKPTSGWTSTSTFDAELTAADGAASDVFGSSVAVEGNTVVVGAWGADLGSVQDAGAAYVFFKPAAGWTTTSAFDVKLTAADAAQSDRFGRAVSIRGTLVVAGAPNANIDSDSDRGAAYVFEVSQAVCGNGIVEAPVEECDDGNTLEDGNCCSATCTFTAGAPCDDGVFCTATDTCDAETHSCRGSGDPCVGEECQVCDEVANQCVPRPQGTACGDDNNPCTDDVCNATGACTHPPNSAGCNDGVFCNGVDVCRDGVCTHLGNPCAGGAACNDACNEDAHNCLAPAGTPCPDDGNPCTVGFCDGTGECVHTFADADGDGVCDAVEDAAPNGGDGNGDGTPDSSQPWVTSLPDAAGGGYLTLLANDRCPQRNVVAIGSAGLSTPGYRLPFGSLSFTLECTSALVTVYYHGVAGLADPPFRYLKRGPNPPGSPTDVVYFLDNAEFGVASPYGSPVGAVQFLLQDNVVGDDTGADGRIVDQGGPALPLPALTPIGSGMTFVLAVVILAGLGLLRLLLAPSR
ncbi:MAG: hypothetical protein KatS3mg077_1320 [Candidatus Binatia bacterium]|nr:MAG: hypothetical protein KatS3mg077_1320 [Candidatus Binatia bacterium]